MFSAPSPVKMPDTLTSLSNEREPCDSNARRNSAQPSSSWRSRALAAVQMRRPQFALNHTQHMSEAGAMIMRNLKKCRTNSSMDESDGT